jgi:hypothetical protein
MKIEQNLSNEERRLYFSLSNFKKESVNIENILSRDKVALESYKADSEKYLKDLETRFRKLILDEDKY